MAESTPQVNFSEACPWCSSAMQYVIHSGVCPKIKSIEYHPNGSVRQVEFRDPHYLPPSPPAEPPAPPPVTADNQDVEQQLRTLVNLLVDYAKSRAGFLLIHGLRDTEDINPLIAQINARLRELGLWPDSSPPTTP